MTVARVGAHRRDTAPRRHARSCRATGGRGAGAAGGQHRRAARRGRTWCPTAPTSSTCTSTSAARSALDQPGTLYDYVYADQTPDFPLPFTYPPFAAVVFYPLHLLPFGFVAFAWQLGIIAALYGVVRISQRLLPGLDRRPARRDAVDRGRHLDRTAAQHVRLRPDQRAAGAGGAVRGVQHAVVAVRAAGRAGRGGEADACGRRAVLRGRAALGRPRCSRRWCSSRRSGCPRWSSATRPVTTSPNCSATPAGSGRSERRSTSRGAAASRASSATTPGYGPLGGGGDRGHRGAGRAGLACARRRDDRPARRSSSSCSCSGCLLSPISWTHHWVWLLPLMIWLLHGPLRDRLGARCSAGAGWR